MKLLMAFQPTNGAVAPKKEIKLCFEVKRGEMNDLNLSQNRLWNNESQTKEVLVSYESQVGRDFIFNFQYIYQSA